MKKLLVLAGVIIISSSLFSCGASSSSCVSNDNAPAINQEMNEDIVLAELKNS